MLDRLRQPWQDNRAERSLGAVAVLIAVGVVAMVAFVAVHAWPTFSHDGLSWLGPAPKGTSLEEQIATMQATGVNAPAAAYHLSAWPLIYGTILCTVPAVLIGLAVAILSSIFIVEFAPGRLRRIAIPVIRLLASVPSVVYGLIGDSRAGSVRRQPPDHGLGEDLGPEHRRADRRRAARGDRDPDGDDHADHGRADLRGAGLGSALLARGGDRARREPRRAMLAVCLRAARPAIVAAAVLATARALGEAIMISMVSGSRDFAPGLSDGLTFLYEPFRSLASAIVDYHEGIGAPALSSALYAFALLLLFSALVLSVGGYLIKLPLRRYQVRG